MLKTTLLFVATALAEIIGCFLLFAFYDWVGASVALLGMAIIVWGWRGQ